MYRIAPPTCTVCKSRPAQWGSQRWESLLLCNDCREQAIEFIIGESGVIHGNPILIELAMPGDNGNRTGAIRIWRKRPNQSSTFAEFYIRLKSDESNLPVDNSLDLLDDL